MGLSNYLIREEESQLIYLVKPGKQNTVARLLLDCGIEASGNRKAKIALVQDSIVILSTDSTN